MYINPPPPKTPLKIITMCMSPQYYCLNDYPQVRSIAQKDIHAVELSCRWWAAATKATGVVVAAAVSSESASSAELSILNSKMHWKVWSPWGFAVRLEDKWMTLTGGRFCPEAPWVGFCAPLLNAFKGWKNVMILRLCIEKCEVFKELLVG